MSEFLVQNSLKHIFFFPVKSPTQWEEIVPNFRQVVQREEGFAKNKGTFSECGETDCQS